MASLTAHLRQPDDHARLSFHPECPICRRERLSGAPPADAIVSPRTRALLAAGLLAISSATPTAVLAAEPDQELEGTTAPEQVAEDGQSAPEVEMGAPPTELQFDAGPAPETDASSDATADAAPAEQEPVTNEDMVPVDATDETTTPAASEQQQPATAAPVQAPAPAEAGTPEPPSVPAPDPLAQAAPVAIHHEPQAAGTTPPREHEPNSDRGATPPRSDTARESEPRSPALAPTQPQSPMPVAHLMTVASTIAPGESVKTRPAASTSGTVLHARAARRSDRFHVVRQGESLWSIASDLLGHGASPARIAREANRLWELNSSRIGTGNRDLLMVGTKLVL